jgi:hypothetical protein
MEPEGQRADAHPPVTDPCAGWDLVQCDWGLRQGEPVAPRSCPVMRILAAPVAAVQSLLRGRVRC